jgi:hypothetical protein
MTTEQATTRSYGRVAVIYTASTADIFSPAWPKPPTCC